MSRNIMEEKRLKELREILEKGWSKKTAHFTRQKEWNPENKKAYGQCYLTARALHDILGWEMMNMRSPYYHYWNRLPDGTEVDFTSDQYGGDGIHKMEEFEGNVVKRKDRSASRFYFHSNRQGRLATKRRYRNINYRMRTYLDIVEGPLQEFKEKYSDVLAEK